MDRNSHKREQPKHFILANLPSCSIREHRRVSSVCLDKPTAYTYTLLTALGFKHLRTEGNSVSQLKKKEKKKDTDVQQQLWTDSAQMYVCI